jgi:hypothetical protein
MGARKRQGGGQQAKSDSRQIFKNNNGGIQSDSDRGPRNRNAHTTYGYHFGNVNCEKPATPKRFAGEPSNRGSHAKNMSTNAFKRKQTSAGTQNTQTKKRGMGNATVKGAKKTSSWPKKERNALGKATKIGSEKGRRGASEKHARGTIKYRGGRTREMEEGMEEWEQRTTPEQCWP